MRLSSLSDLITSPGSGRLSTSDTMVFGAFMVSSFVLVWVTVTRTDIPAELYWAYLGAWVAQSQASKHMSIKRAREVPNVADGAETSQK